MVPPLFKFRSINEANFDDCFTLASLRESIVYFSNMTTLNDPFEMGAFLDQVSDPDAVRDEFMTRDWSGSPISRKLKTMNLWQREKFLEESWNNEDFRERFIASLREVDTFDEDLKEILSVYCASATREDGLLWAHYASGHRGIAIELDPNADKLLQNARRVSYEDEFPVIDVLRDDDDTKFRKGVLTKSSAWKYEEEYRSVHPEPCENMRHEVDSSVFVSITFGAKIAEQTRDEVIRATRIRLPNIRFEQARLGKKSFSVKFEEFTA